MTETDISREETVFRHDSRNGMVMPSRRLCKCDSGQALIETFFPIRVAVWSPGRGGRATYLEAIPEGIRQKAPQKETNINPITTTSRVKSCRYVANC